MLIASLFSLQLSSRYNKDYLHSSVMKETWNTGNYRYLLKKGIVAINRLTFYFAASVLRIDKRIDRLQFFWLSPLCVSV
jgi:hypothetical protein